MKTNISMDFGELGEQEVEVDFDFDPEIKQTFEEQGWSAQAYVNSIIWRGVDITKLLTEKQTRYIEQELVELATQ